MKKNANHHPSPELLEAVSEPCESIAGILMYKYVHQLYIYIYNNMYGNYIHQSYMHIYLIYVYLHMYIYICIFIYAYISFLGISSAVSVAGTCFFTFSLKAAPLLPFFPTLLEQQVNMNVSWTAKVSLDRHFSQAIKRDKLEMKMVKIRLIEEILHQLIGSLSHYLQSFTHPRWCRISSINSIIEFSSLKVNEAVLVSFDFQKSGCK